MVLIWNDLARGDAELCAVLVAVNSTLQIVLYLPLALFYVKVLGGGSVNVGVWDVAKSVLLFLGVPLVAGIITRYTIFLIAGKAWFEERFVPIISPLALIGKKISLYFSQVTCIIPISLATLILIPNMSYNGSHYMLACRHLCHVGDLVFT